MADELKECPECLGTKWDYHLADVPYDECVDCEYRDYGVKP